ncbi:phosphatase PAP2 family protein [Filimonas effusa]|uniref:Phosphatase PAP2 family protein n=1 Tax=Filimonas effusa TaxID=2508721 RepID=A0A4Q1D0Q2_9BACT|nr:phosphatase PAP2 family protein [Filimonas effusa]RXK81333.1 phosphatase PAP2 family protein [Filimonas effusa]
MRVLNTNSFKTGAIITLVLGISVLACSFAVGKQALFLLLNTDLGRVADYFFAGATYLGDGAVWVPLLIWVLVKRRKELLPLLISSFALTTLLTQVCKYIIVPHEARPTKAIADISLIHTVPGVELHTVSSFPSGHTATAFTIYLLLCLLIRQRAWVGIGLLYALAVAYSRVYLAQHFPLDLGAGMIVAFLSASGALLIQQKIQAKKEAVS